MEIITKENFKEVVANGVVLVDFFATWCGPCKMLSPVLEKTAGELEGKVKIVKVDVDQDGELAMQFSVMSVPTMIIFKNGEAVKQLQGFTPQPQLISALSEFI